MNPKNHTGRGLVHGAAILVIARALTMVLGLLQTVLLARWFGASVMVDMFFVAFAIPALVLGVVESNLSLAFTPLFVELEESGREGDARVLAATMMKKGMLVVGLYVAATVALAAPLATMLAPGFSPEDHQELVVMIRCISPLALPMYFSAALASICFVRGSFLLPAITYILGAATPLATLILFQDGAGIYALPAGLFAGSALGGMLLFSRFGAGHPVFSTASNIKHPVVRQFGKAMALRTAATSLMQVNVAVDGAFASTVAPGHVAHLAYASRVLMAVRRMLVIPLGRSLMPALSRAAAAGDYQSVRRIVLTATGVLGFFIIPVFAFLIYFSDDLVGLLFASSTFSAEAVRYTSIALMMYGLGALSAVLNPVLTATHFALRDSTSPLMVAIVGVVLNALLNYVCLLILPRGGIALATSLVMAAASVMLWRNLSKLCGGLGLREVGVSLGRSLFASLAMVGAAHFVHSTGLGPAGFHPVIPLLTAFMAGGVVYLAVQLVLGPGQFRLLMSVIRKR